MRTISDRHRPYAVRKSKIDGLRRRSTAYTIVTHGVRQSCFACSINLFGGILTVCIPRNQPNNLPGVRSRGDRNKKISQRKKIGLSTAAWDQNRQNSV